MNEITIIAKGKRSSMVLEWNTHTHTHLASGEKGRERERGVTLCQGNKRACVGGKQPRQTFCAKLEVKLEDSLRANLLKQKINKLENNKKQ